MSKRRKQLDGLFDDGPAQSLEQVDQLTYGLVGQVDQSRIVAEGRNIFDIRPDFQQPRRVVPSEIVRMCWEEPSYFDVKDIDIYLKKWEKQAQREIAREFCGGDDKEGLYKAAGILHIPDRMTEDEIEDDPLAADIPDDMVVTKALLKIIRLAKDIFDNGLTNPITVVRDGRQFLVQTGERRWWAYQLLNANAKYWDLVDTRTWNQIPAREVEPNLWSQASENTQRDDLSGIALARQFALLLMDLYTERENEAWGTIQEFMVDGCDRAFYAQVEDGNMWPIPYGTSQKVADAMGVSPSNMRRYRSFLKLPNEIWIKADDEGWSVNAIKQWIIEDNRADEPVKVQTTVSTDTHVGDTSADEPSPPTPLPQAGEGSISPEVDWDDMPTLSGVPDLGAVNDAAPAGVTVQKLDKGNGADVYVPKTDEDAARWREAQLRIPIQELTKQVERLISNRDILILNELDIETRLGLLAVMRTAILRTLNLSDQLIRGLPVEEVKPLVQEYMGLNERLVEIGDMIWQWVQNEDAGWSG